MKNIATIVLILVSTLLVLGCENEKEISLCSCAEFSEKDMERFKEPWSEDNITATVTKSFSEGAFSESESDLYKHLLPASKKECVVELKFKSVTSKFSNQRWAVVKGSKECPSVGSKIFGNIHMQLLDFKLFIYDATFTVQSV